MKKLYDMVYTEKWNDKETGEERKKYVNIGSVLQRDDGSMCANLLGSWINFYEPSNRKPNNSAGGQSNYSATAPKQDDIEDSEIPF